MNQSKKAWKNTKDSHSHSTDPKEKKKVFYLSDFDSAFFNDLIAYFRKEKNISDNTLKENRVFQIFLNWCVRNGYSVNSAFKDVQVKKGKHHTFLCHILI